MNNRCISPFIYNLYATLEQQKDSCFLLWDEKGEAIMIIDPESIDKAFLESHFRYECIDMLIKALYKHGFSKHKRGSSEATAKYGKEILLFKHRYFQYGRVDLLHKVETVLSIREMTGGFIGPEHYGPNIVMRHQENFIKTLVSASKYFQLLCEQATALKQEILKRNGIRRFKNPKVILFDEDVCSRITMTSYLKKAGFVTYLAESGNDVVFKCSRKNFRIIILSIHMPNIIAVLKKLCSEKKQVALLLTYKNEELRYDLEEFRRLGVDEFVLSPCTEEHFMSVIRRTETGGSI